MIGPKADSISWAATFEREESSCLLPQAIAVSENGEHIALVGANNGGWIALVSVEQKKVLWEKVPNMSVGFDDVTFSEDGKTVYTGSAGGRVYGFDVETGAIKSRWVVSEAVGVAYGGHGITTMAASSDGRFVAAGTSMQGLIFVWEAASGKRLVVLNPGDMTTMGLAFSPDSKFLASAGVRSPNIKIWQLPAAPAKQGKE